MNIRERIDSIKESIISSPLYKHVKTITTFPSEKEGTIDIEFKDETLAHIDLYEKENFIRYSRNGHHFDLLSILDVLIFFE